MHILASNYFSDKKYFIWCSSTRSIAAIFLLLFCLLALILLTTCMHILPTSSSMDFTEPPPAMPLPSLSPPNAKRPRLDTTITHSPSPEVVVIDLNNDDDTPSPNIILPSRNHISQDRPATLPSFPIIDLDNDASLAAILPPPPLPPPQQQQPQLQLQLQPQQQQQQQQQQQPLVDSKIHVSSGGSLFRVQESGSVEIFDSDDEEYLASSNRLINTASGIHTIDNFSSNNNISSFFSSVAAVADQPALQQPWAVNSSAPLHDSLPPIVPPPSAPVMTTFLQSMNSVPNGLPNDLLPLLNIATPPPPSSNPQLSSMPMDNLPFFGPTPDISLLFPIPMSLPPPPVPQIGHPQSPLEQPKASDIEPIPFHPAPARPSVAPSNAVHTFQEGLSEADLRNLVKQNGMTADATEAADNPPELSVSLMMHQRRALAWMAKREKPIDLDQDVIIADEECLGGILADDQGLGKTLTMIALLIINRPKSEPPDLGSSSKSTSDDADSEGTDFMAPKTTKNSKPWRTLIICPLCLINQWKEEILCRIKPPFHPSICIYHGPKRVRSKEALEEYDVVITTYSTLAHEYPKIMKDHPEHDLRKAAKLPLPRRTKGPLCRVSWSRVVLDEAQYVKNRGTDSWSACMSLKSEVRWCLTGTPIQNSVDDMYSLFCFIRYHFVPSYEVWNLRWKKKLESNNAQVREKAFKRFQTIVGVVLLRRTKKDTINGKPLITLPKRIPDLKVQSFDDTEEAAVYRAVQEKTVLTVNKFLIAGNLATNYSSVLLLLLRLRQACSHPFLIQYTRMYGSNNSSGVMDHRYSTVYSQEELEEAMELVAGGHSILNMIEEPAKDRVKQMLSPPKKDGVKVSTSFCCGNCKSFVPWVDGSFLACGDLFCTDCCSILRMERRCFLCKYDIGDPNKMEVFFNACDFRKEIHASIILVGNGLDKGFSLSPARFKEWVQEELKRRKAFSKGGGSGEELHVKTENVSLDDIDDDVVIADLKKRSEKEAACANKRKLLDAFSQHSTKIRIIIEELNKTRKEDRRLKTLIFSQWTSMLDIIEFHVQMKGHKVARLDGSMALTARQKQIDEFKQSETTNVFLISLHAGGTGLNLTAACRVILADVWWNPAVEEQAIDRVHRIGQTRDVSVIRFKMQGTVEERIYSICSRKREAADGSLGVTGAQSLGRKKLSMQELMFLFSGAAQDVAKAAGQGSAVAEAAKNILNYGRGDGMDVDIVE